MFQFFRFPRLAAWSGMTQTGFPHSDMVGSQPAHGSPTLFAVYHVLLRLLAPRHPPFAFRHFFPHAENTLSFSYSSSQHSAVSSQLTAGLDTLLGFAFVLDALFYSVIKVLRPRGRSRLCDRGRELTR